MNLLLRVLLVFRYFFQHESLSVKMFNHLVEENKLDNEFKRYFGKNLVKDKHKIFITEMIEGPPETESKVQDICF